MLHAETPDVCAGPNGETVWPGTGEHSGPIRGFAEGLCRVGASMDGDKPLRTFTYPQFILEPSDLWPIEGERCEVEGSTGCSTYSVAACLNGRWVYQAECAKDQTCDVKPAGSAGCVPGGPCAACRGLLQRK
jgi:hypothetical protein